MKQGQAYIVRCHTKPPEGTYDDFRKGDYVGKDGNVVRKVDNCYIFQYGTGDFGFDDGFTWGCPGDYFEALPINIVAQDPVPWPED